ncbi:MAG: 50S ribosomal protein L19 [Planctomycetaceae bacterium]|jgi:large subunit ribosomal protein L19|nr:50S ribosomal protein L19 [Planctomycetaceae bacterium]
MSDKILKIVEANCVKPASEINDFEIGDTVNVHCRILEGEKERIQIFNGVVIARSGSGTREMFTVRRIVAGEGVERKFALHSPRIAKIETVRSAVVHRAKLYFLRDRVGKAVRLKERVVKRKVVETKVQKTKKRGSRGKKKTTEPVVSSAE